MQPILQHRAFIRWASALHDLDGYEPYKSEGAERKEALLTRYLSSAAMDAPFTGRLAGSGRDLSLVTMPNEALGYQALEGKVEVREAELEQPRHAKELERMQDAIASLAARVKTLQEGGRTKEQPSRTLEEWHMIAAQCLAGAADDSPDTRPGGGLLLHERRALRVAAMPPDGAWVWSCLIARIALGPRGIWAREGAKALLTQFYSLTRAQAQRFGKALHEHAMEGAPLDYLHDPVTFIHEVCRAAEVDISKWESRHVLCYSESRLPVLTALACVGRASGAHLQELEAFRSASPASHQWVEAFIRAANARRANDVIERYHIGAALAAWQNFAARMTLINPRMAASQEDTHADP